MDSIRAYLQEFSLWPRDKKALDITLAAMILDELSSLEPEANGKLLHTRWELEARDGEKPLEGGGSPSGV